MSTKQKKLGLQVGRATKLLICGAAAALLSACGGGEEAVFAEVSAQKQKEAAALAKAHALNASTMRQIQSERAGRQRSQ